MKYFIVLFLSLLCFSCQKKIDKKPEANQPNVIFISIDDSKELYNLESDPEEWTNLASDSNYENTILKLDTFIPKNPLDLPLSSLIELQEHHIAPIQSKEHYESIERKEWMKRFDNL